MLTLLPSYIPVEMKLFLKLKFEFTETIATEISRKLGATDNLNLDLKWK